MQDIRYNKIVHFYFAQCYNQKGFAQPFLIIAVLILVAFGVYRLTTPLSTSNPPSTLSSPTVPDVSEFNNYSNESLGFLFKHAKNLAVKQDSEEEFNKRENGDFRKNFKGYVMYEPAQVLGAVTVLEKDNSFDLAPFSVWVFDNSEQLNSSQWFEKYWFYPYLWGVFSEPDKGHIRPEKEATVSGQTVKYSVVSYQPGSPKYILISQNQRIYLLRVVGGEGEKILQSFKFGGSQDKTAYTCPQNGWENCMPVLTPESQKQCSEEALSWKKINCSNFKGAAY